jgi:argonaute-like protein implicated in RNA metabolism and viral defense
MSARIYPPSTIRNAIREFNSRNTHQIGEICFDENRNLIQITSENNDFTQITQTTNFDFLNFCKSDVKKISNLVNQVFEKTLRTIYV